MGGVQEETVYLNWWTGPGKAHYFRPQYGSFVDRSACGQMAKTLLDVEWVHSTDKDQHCLKCLQAEAEDLEFKEFAVKCGML